MPSTCCRPRPFRRLTLWGACSLVLLGFVGCEKPEIKQYDAARDKQTPDYTRLSDYTLPKGWTRLAQPKDFSVATFQVSRDGKTALITVSRLPGSGGGLVPNIARWRGKAGMPE